MTVDWRSDEDLTGGVFLISARAMPMAERGMAEEVRLFTAGRDQDPDDEPGLTTRNASPTGTDNFDSLP
ncbi:MAG: hypothetical protein AAFU49_15645, partial [Pseudomonadota bacterium]